MQGVSAREVKAVTEALCDDEFSASSISQINKTLDEALRRRTADRSAPFTDAFVANHTPQATGSVQPHAGCDRDWARSSCRTGCHAGEGAPPENPFRMLSYIPLPIASTVPR